MPEKRSDSRHDAQVAVHLNPITCPNHGGGTLAPRDAGKAQFPCNDRGMARRPALVGDQCSDQMQLWHPVGRQQGTDQGLARLQGRQIFLGVHDPRSASRPALATLGQQVCTARAHSKAPGGRMPARGSKVFRGDLLTAAIQVTPFRNSHQSVSDYEPFHTA